MRKHPNTRIEKYRDLGYSDTKDGNNGIFWVKDLKIIASDGMGWDHVSVSLNLRCPTWKEMCRVKGLFFRDDECVVQYHPAKNDHIDIHEFCLHLWRPQGVEIPMPMPEMV